MDNGKSGLLRGARSNIRLGILASCARIFSLKGAEVPFTPGLDFLLMPESRSR
jgi:hypothetical protein